jgi:hypothetical protein
VVPTVPLFHYFSIVRGPGRCADGRFVTVQEGRGGHLRVCRPILYLYIPSWAVWTSWDRNYRPHARLRSHNKQMIVYIEKSQTVPARRIHTLTFHVVHCRNDSPLKQLIFPSCLTIPHDPSPRLDGEDGRLSGSHCRCREDRPMRLVQWVGPVTKPTRHHPGAA